MEKNRLMKCLVSSKDEASEQSVYTQDDLDFLNAYNFHNFFCKDENNMWEDMSHVVEGLYPSVEDLFKEYIKQMYFKTRKQSDDDLNVYK